MNKPKENVEVRLCKRRQDGSLYWEVFVRSYKIPRLKWKGIVEWVSTDQTKQIGILAAALAEGLAEKYSDSKLDPDSVYRTAANLYATIRVKGIELYGEGDELPRSADSRLATH